MSALNQASVNNQVASEVYRAAGLTGPQLFLAAIDRAETCIFAFFKKQNGQEVAFAPVGYTSKSAVATGYSGDGTTQSFTGQSLTGPVAPGTLSILATTGAPALADSQEDGNLYMQSGARAAGASATFAAMSNEQMTLMVDGDSRVRTVQFGTEASQAAAIATIQAQLGSVATCTALDSNNVAITSNSSGFGSSVQIVSADAGVTTKLGLSVGTFTTLMGSVNYFSGKLTLSYANGYAPVAGGATAATVTSTVAGPYDMVSSGLTFIGTIDSGSSQTITMTGNTATVAGVVTPADLPMAGETMVVQFAGNDATTVTFGTEATLADVVNTVNAAIVGGSCTSTGSTNITLTSDWQGSGASIILSAVSAGITTKLGLSGGTTSATAGSNCVNIHAVTVAELNTAFNAAGKFNNTVTITTSPLGHMVLTSNTTGTGSHVNITGGTGLTALGFIVHNYAGSASGTAAIQASYIQTPAATTGPFANFSTTLQMSPLDELIVDAIAEMRFCSVRSSTTPLTLQQV